MMLNEQEQIESMIYEEDNYSHEQIGSNTADFPPIAEQTDDGPIIDDKSEQSADRSATDVYDENVCEEVHVTAIGDTCAECNAVGPNTADRYKNG